MKNISMVAIASVLACSGAQAARANSTPQALPFSQAWTDTTLLAVNNDWSTVPGLIGYAGNGLTATTGTDPRTILADGTSTAVNVLANQADPATTPSGGLAEFHLADPTVGVQGSGAASAPFLLMNLDTSNNFLIHVQYDLRDIEAGSDNSVQQVALHYRVGAAGPWTNLPAGYVADATTGPGIATKVTHIDALLPAACENQPLVQIRVMSSNAPGSDEWVGIDNIAVTGNAVTPTRPTTWGRLKANYR